MDIVSDSSNGFEQTLRLANLIRANVNDNRDAHCVCWGGGVCTQMGRRAQKGGEGVLRQSRVSTMGMLTAAAQ